MCKISKAKVDERGVPYSEYPECPNPDCPKINGVGRNNMGRTGNPVLDKHIKNWICYSCRKTFDE